MASENKHVGGVKRKEVSTSQSLKSNNKKTKSVSFADDLDSSESKLEEDNLLCKGDDNANKKSDALKEIKDDKITQHKRDVPTSKKVRMVNDLPESTITLTFGDQAENHVGMLKIGTPTKRGFSLDDLKQTRSKFEKCGLTCELIDLINEADFGDVDTSILQPAYLLIVRKASQYLLDDGKNCDVNGETETKASYGDDSTLSTLSTLSSSSSSSTSASLPTTTRTTNIIRKTKQHSIIHFIEGTSETNGERLTNNLFTMLRFKLKWDTEVLINGQLVNKRARHNLCFDHHSQEPDIAKGRGTIVAYDSVPLLKKLLGSFGRFFDKPPHFLTSSLKTEGNYYYDISKCGVDYHGDRERKIVIAIRLGTSMELNFRWYYKHRPMAKRMEFTLQHGDMYVMSSKAVGNDWKRDSIFTLRHAAGERGSSYLTFQQQNIFIPLTPPLS
jgi:hypothetical protein